MSPAKDAPRAYVYIDGFNLYHGCFKAPHRVAWRQYRWLDLVTLSERLFPQFQILKVRYFTARIRATADDLDGPVRQDTYLRALATNSRIEIHEGRFSVWAKTRTLADPSSRPPVPLVPKQTALVLQPEEKGSDVNLASHLIVDGFRNRYDIAVVVSNDSDLAEPVRLVRSELHSRVYVVNPRNTTASDLLGIADGYRKIRMGVVRDSQLPEKLLDLDGSVLSRPSSW